jgi:hypothetical protein
MILFGQLALFVGMCCALQWKWFQDNLVAQGHGARR